MLIWCKLILVWSIYTVGIFGVIREDPLAAEKVTGVGLQVVLC